MPKAPGTGARPPRPCWPTWRHPARARRGGRGRRGGLGGPAAGGGPGRTRGRAARRLPFGRQATAWEVAYATVWLVSGESSSVNAHPLVLDGGATSFG